MQPRDFWMETAADREARLLRQADDRASCANDGMELFYSEDVDELFAELLRLHAIVKDQRTQELLDRLFGDQAPNMRRL
jgi:hypothetical protein